MKVTIDVSSREAESILFSLVMRNKQTRLSEHQAKEAEDVAKRLNETFEKAFGWYVFDRVKHMQRGIKSVSIKLYDFPKD